MNRPGRLEGKVAIVTGAARGIGAAIARRFAEEGARVVLSDLLPEGADVAREIGDAGLFHAADVVEEGDWMALADAAERHFGPVDVLVNNAGIAIFGTIAESKLADWEKVMSVNCTGVFLGMKVVGPRMAARGRGSIVNISSNAAMRGVNGAAAYTASKWAVRGLTKVAALELGHRGVRVNSVHPGSTDTAISNSGGRPTDAENPTYRAQPIQRIGRPVEIANLCLFLASDEASYCCGGEFTADGGATIGPYRTELPGYPDNLVRPS